MKKKPIKQKQVRQKKQKKEKSKKKLFNNGLRMQITLPFIILIIFAIGIVAFVSYTFSVRTTTEELSNSVENQIVSVNDTFNLYFTNMENHLTRMGNSSTLRHYTGETFNDVYSALQETIDTDPYIKTAYAGYEQDGEVIMYPYNSGADGLYAIEEEWYQKAVAAEGQIIWDEPFIDEQTGRYFVTAAKAFYVSDGLVGVAAIDIETHALLQIMNNIAIGDEGYTVTVDQAGNYITNPVESLIGTNISEENYYQEIQTAGERGVIETSVDGEEIIIGFIQNDTTDWMLGGIIHKSEFTSKANVILIPIAIALIGVIIIALIAAMLISKRIIKPIHKLQTTMKQVEDGDLTAKVEHQRNDEVGELGRSFENMLMQMRHMMKQISGVSYKVSDAAQNLVASSEQNTASANEVAKTMEGIATDASNQFDITEQNRTAFEELNEMMTDISDKNKQMQDKAIEMDRLSTDGVRKVQDLAVSSAGTSEMASKVMNAIQQLNEKSANIHSIVDKIANIASQTNLLALNASIEAARAGEHGQGFSVVANEVGKLAEQTTDALKDVASIITEMQDETENSVTLVKGTMDQFEQQSESVGETGEAFLAISSSVNENNKMIEQIMSLTDKIVASEKKLMENTLRFARISEDTAAGTEEISASIEEQTASMEQLTHLATDLESFAIRMQEEIDKFRIE
ncbi:methyl-accepting chemotaxis protein [Oceanobacillus sp. CAU 1775]